METITEIIKWFSAHSADLALVVTSIIGTATLIVKLTPTPKDDAVLGKIKKFVGKYIALND